MIVTAPTGSYLPVLPKGPSDPTSVIYTISAGPPPRANGTFQKIPDGIRDQQKAPKYFTTEQRRLTLGDLVLVTKTVNPPKVNNGSQLFDYGQILEFVPVSVGSGSSSSTAVQSDPINNTVTTKHNNSYINLGDLGFDDSEQQLLATQAAAAQQALLDQIGELQKQSQALEIDIVDIQAQINEATKVLTGLKVIAGTGTDVAQLINRVQIQLTGFQTNLATTMDMYNTIPIQVSALRDSLSNLTTLVK